MIANKKGPAVSEQSLGVNGVADETIFEFCREFRVGNVWAVSWFYINRV